MPIKIPDFLMAISKNYIAKKGDIKKALGFIIIYGLILNYAVFVAFGLEFAIYTFIGWGCVFYLLRVETIKALQELIVSWRRVR